MKMCNLEINMPIFFVFGKPSVKNYKIFKVISFCGLKSFNIRLSCFLFIIYNYISITKVCK